MQQFAMIDRNNSIWSVNEKTKELTYILVLKKTQKNKEIFVTMSCLHVGNNKYKAYTC